MRRMINIFLGIISLPIIAVGYKTLEIGEGSSQLIIGCILLIAVILSELTTDLFHFVPGPHLAKWGEWEKDRPRFCSCCGDKIECKKRECVHCGQIQTRRA